MKFFRGIFGFFQFFGKFFGNFGIFRGKFAKKFAGAVFAILIFSGFFAILPQNFASAAVGTYIDFSFSTNYDAANDRVNITMSMIGRDAGVQYGRPRPGGVVCYKPASWVRGVECQTSPKYTQYECYGWLFSKGNFIIGGKSFNTTFSDNPVRNSYLDGWTIANVSRTIENASDPAVLGPGVYNNITFDYTRDISCGTVQSVDGSATGSVSVVIPQKNSHTMATSYVKNTRTGTVAHTEGTSGQNNNGAWGQSDDITNLNQLPNGEYYLLFNTDPRYAIDVKSSATANGSPVQLYNYNASGAQKWKITLRADGFYEIRNSQSGRVLNNYGADYNNGAKLVIHDQDDTCAGLWGIREAASGEWIIQSACSGHAVEMGNNSVSGDLHLFVNNNTAAQRWNITRVSDLKKMTAANVGELRISTKAKPLDGGPGSATIDARVGDTLEFQHTIMWIASNGRVKPSALYGWSAWVGREIDTAESGRGAVVNPMSLASFGGAYRFQPLKMNLAQGCTSGKDTDVCKYVVQPSDRGKIICQWSAWTPHNEPGNSLGDGRTPKVCVNVPKLDFTLTPRVSASATSVTAGTPVTFDTWVENSGDATEKNMWYSAGAFVIPASDGAVLQGSATNCLDYFTAANAPELANPTKLVCLTHGGGGVAPAQSWLKKYHNAAYNWVGLSPNWNLKLGDGVAFGNGSTGNAHLVSGGKDKNQLDKFTTGANLPLKTDDLNAGDRLCVYNAVGPYRPWGTFSPPRDRASQPACVTIAKNPQMEILGADSNSGAKYFGEKLINSQGGFFATEFVSSDKNKDRGSWSQYGIFTNGASGQIKNFGAAGFTSSLDANKPKSCKLWFANSDAGGGNCTGAGDSGFPFKDNSRKISVPSYAEDVASLTKVPAGFTELKGAQIAPSGFKDFVQKLKPGEYKYYVAGNLQIGDCVLYASGTDPAAMPKHCGPTNTIYDGSVDPKTNYTMFIPRGVHLILVVKGSATVVGNIAPADRLSLNIDSAGTYQNLQAIPSFTVVADEIHIDTDSYTASSYNGDRSSAVQSIFGTYISTSAKKVDSTHANFSTCGAGTGKNGPALAENFKSGTSQAKCNSALIINGAIISKTAPKFWRTFGAGKSLGVPRTSTIYNTNPPTGDIFPFGLYKPLYWGSMWRNAKDYAAMPAEVINYTPNLFLTPYAISESKPKLWQTTSETSLPARY